MWQQTASPAAQEGSGGLRISALLTQGWHCSSDATERGASPRERQKQGLRVAGDHKTSPLHSAPRPNPERVQNPIAGSGSAQAQRLAWSLRFTLTHAQSKTCAVEIYLEPVKGKNQPTDQFIKTLIEPHPG